jgi:hypothetical protein
VSWPADPWVARFCVLAGALDALTGATLVAAPATVMGLFGAGELPGQPIFLRWIGVFVGAVGLSYLYPFAFARARRSARQLVVLEVTAIVRLAVFAFTGTAIVAGALGEAWASVPATDLVLGVAQLWVLRRWSES